MEPRNASPLVKLLVIDDDPQNLEMVASVLEQEGLEIYTIADAEHAKELFQDKRPEIVLLDLVMPRRSGMEVLQDILAVDPGTEVILMTGHYSPESAVEAIRLGAADYLTKPLDFKVIREKIVSLIAEKTRRRETLALDRQLASNFRFEGIVGRSPLMLDVFAMIRRVAPHFRTALISGETGTGKELAARALYHLSPAADKTFAVCNCSALVDTLFESELFGYVRGAFTGANHDKVGLFEYANGGVIFLDEIGDMPLAGQAKLLRVIQNQEVQRVGSPVPKKISVRVIAATNRDLVTMVKEQRFREDLYYRLSMVELRLPSLAERKEDLPILYKYFVEKFSAEYGKEIAGITRRAQVLLGRYHWPGNVRELENALGNACMLVDGSFIDVKHLAERLRIALSPEQLRDDKLLSMEDVQERHLLKVLDQVGGDKVRAAEVLGIARATVYNMLSRIDAKRKAN